MSIDYTSFLTDERITRLKRTLDKRQTTLTVVLENIIDPHNLSACLRSCDATGVSKVYLIYDGSQPFPKLKSSSSASASKWIEVEKYKSVKECFEEIKKDGFKIYTTHMSAQSVPLYEIDFTSKIAIVFGNEHFGVSELAVNQADGNFLIPQVGMIQSLNISVACAVSLYEAFRQRHEAGMYDSPQLTPDNYSTKLNKWAQKK